MTRLVTSQREKSRDAAIRAPARHLLTYHVNAVGAEFIAAFSIETRHTAFITKSRVSLAPVVGTVVTLVLAGSPIVASHTLT